MISLLRILTREEGVQNPENSADVTCEWPLRKASHDNLKGAVRVDPYEDADARGHEYGGEAEVPVAAVFGLLARRLLSLHITLSGIGGTTGFRASC